MSANNAFAQGKVTPAQLIAAVSRLKGLLRGWECAQSHALDIPSRFVVLSVLRHLTGLEPDARQGLIEFERLLFALDGRPPPQPTLPEVMKSRIVGSHRGCGTEYFAVYCPRGAGDVHLRCKRQDLITLANQMIAIGVRTQETESTVAAGTSAPLDLPP